MSTFPAKTRVAMCVACTLSVSERNCGPCGFNVGVPIKLAHHYELQNPDSNHTAIVIERMLEKATPEQVDLFCWYMDFVYPIPGDLPWKKCDACDHPTRGELCASCWLDAQEV